MLNEKNTYNLFHQMHEYLDLSDHVFLVADFKCNLPNFPKLREFKNFVFMDAPNRLMRIIKLYKYCKKADHIILNSLLYKTSKYLFFFYFFRSFLRKATWIEWGADLYNYRQEKKGLKSKIINHINYFIRNNVKYVGLTFPGDEYKYREEFPESKAQCFFTPLPFGKNRIDIMNAALKKQSEKTHSEVRVQVAHNSLQINNHYSVLMALSRFKYKNIKVLVPLSYGEFGLNGQYGGNGYKFSVAEYAKTTFGEKAEILLQMMPIEEYIEYLAGIDIAIMSCERPIALANIYYLLYMGKKVYLPKNSIQYKYFSKGGYKVFDSDTIDDLSWEEFSAPIKRKIPKALSDKFTVGKEIMYWKKLFDQIEKDIGKK